MWPSKMDYLSIGSSGFAQLGEDDYLEKMRVEMAVLLPKIAEAFPVPEKFKSIASLKVKSFPHDFGRYHEVCLVYNREVVEEWELSDNEADNDNYNDFWDWANAVECFDLESEDILAEIQAQWNDYAIENATLEVVHKVNPEDKKLRKVN